MRECGGCGKVHGRPYCCGCSTGRVKTKDLCPGFIAGQPDQHCRIEPERIMSDSDPIYVAAARGLRK